MFNLVKSLTLKQLSRKGYRLQRIRDPYSDQRRLLADGTPAVIIDIGANRGETVARYRDIFPGAVIYAFEPFPDHASVLRERFKHDRRITVVEAAVGREPGKALLNISGGKSTHSLLNRSTAGDRYLPDRAVLQGQLEVDVTSLDEFCRQQGIRVIDALKVDVEGAELQVLEGSNQLLTEQRITLMLLEVMFIAHYADQPLYFEVAKLLSTRGYDVYDFFDLTRSRQNGQLRFANALFLSPAFRSHALRL